MVETYPNHKKQDKSNALICYPTTIPEIFPDFFFLAILFQMMVVSSSSTQMEIVILYAKPTIKFHLVVPDIINGKQNAKNEKTPKISAEYFHDFCLVMPKQSVDKLKQGFCLTC